jgi:hypothetical protein
LEVAVDQADADSSLGADIMHAGLVETFPGEAEDCRVEDLGSAIEAGGDGRVGLEETHGGGKDE